MSAVKQLNASGQSLWCDDLFVDVLLWRQSYANIFACVTSQMQQ